MRLAPFGPVQRRGHQIPEQRVGPVGPALELGMGLGADPERVLAQLDELDQAAVGRGARADQADRFELGGSGC